MLMSTYKKDILFLKKRFGLGTEDATDIQTISKKEFLSVTAINRCIFKTMLAIFINESEKSGSETIYKNFTQSERHLMWFVCLLSIMNKQGIQLSLHQVRMLHTVSKEDIMEFKDMVLFFWKKADRRQRIILKPVIKETLFELTKSMDIDYRMTNGIWEALFDLEKSAIHYRFLGAIFNSYPTKVRENIRRLLNNDLWYPFEYKLK